MITYGGESFSLSFEPDVDVFTIFGVLDIRPTHFGHEAQIVFSTTGKERSAKRETKCQCRQGKDFSDHDGFFMGLSMSTEDCICNMGLGCFEWVHYQKRDHPWC